MCMGNDFTIYRNKGPQLATWCYTLLYPPKSGRQGWGTVMRAYSTLQRRRRKKKKKKPIMITLWLQSSKIHYNFQGGLNVLGLNFYWTCLTLVSSYLENFCFLQDQNKIQMPFKFPSVYQHPWIDNGRENAETLSWAWEEGSQQTTGNILPRTEKGSEEGHLPRTCHSPGRTLWMF